MRTHRFLLASIALGTAAMLGGCTQPAEPTPVVVKKPIIVEPTPPPRVDVGGPRGGVHVDVPRDDGRDIRVDIPPRTTPPATP
jgi:hypothetical protein